MTTPRDRRRPVTQADVDITVRYLPWDEERQKEWIREAASLAVDAFLEDEAREMQARSFDRLDSADRLRP